MEDIYQLYEKINNEGDIWFNPKSIRPITINVVSETIGIKLAIIIPVLSPKKMSIMINTIDTA